MYITRITYDNNYLLVLCTVLDMSGEIFIIWLAVNYQSKKKTKDVQPSQKTTHTHTHTEQPVIKIKIDTPTQSIKRRNKRENSKLQFSEK